MTDNDILAETVQRRSMSCVGIGERLMRYIDADKLKQHYAWWNNEDKKTFDEIVDEQPTADVRGNIKAQKVLAGGILDGTTKESGKLQAS